jgi:hypothetical protein
MERVYAGNLVQAVVRTDNGGQLVVEAGAASPLAREGARVLACWAPGDAVLLRGEEGTER